MELQTCADEIVAEPDIALLKAMCRAIEEHLRGARDLLSEEIGSYPTPIPRCDAQFNHLYEQRSRIVLDLDRVAALAAGNPSREEYAALIRSFIAPQRRG